MRGKGEGSISQDAKTGLWVGRIELPTHDLDANGQPKRRRKVIRRKDKADLIREMNKLRTRLQRSGDLPTASMTVEQWFDYWLRNIAAKEKRPATMRSYRSIVSKHIIPSIGKVRLEKVTAENVRRVLIAMDQKDTSPTYRRNAFSVMSAAFKIAEREGKIGRNPCDLMDAPLKGIPELDVLTPDEAKMLVASFRESPEAFLWATFILTGARRGEILGLEWDRVTDELDMSWQLQRITWAHGCGDDPGKGKTWPCGYKRASSCNKKRLELPDDYEYRRAKGGLYFTRPKSRAGWRIIPLVEPLASILERWREKSGGEGLVFTNHGDPIDPDVATTAWPEVLKAVGIDKKVRIHDLRHTAVDLLYASGVREDIILRIVGHSSRAMSRSYKSNSDRVQLRLAMTQFSSMFELTPGG